MEINILIYQLKNKSKDHFQPKFNNKKAQINLKTLNKFITPDLNLVMDLYKKGKNLQNKVYYRKIKVLFHSQMNLKHFIKK